MPGAERSMIYRICVTYHFDGVTVDESVSRDGGGHGSDVCPAHGATLVV